MTKNSVALNSGTLRWALAQDRGPLVLYAKTATGRRDGGGHYGREFECGFAIHKVSADESVNGLVRWELYSDDGQGNGDFILAVDDIFDLFKMAEEADQR